MADRARCFEFLPGEAVEGDVPEEPEHWIAVYGELARFCQDVLARPGNEVDRADVARQMIHYRARLDFWEARRTGTAHETGQA
jgi:hypothetical protein